MVARVHAPQTRVAVTQVLPDNIGLLTDVEKQAIVPVTHVPASMQVLLQTIAPHKQVLPKITGLQPQVVNNPHAPQCNGEFEQVLPYITGEATQVPPQVIAPHTQVVPNKHAPQTRVAVTQVLPDIIGLLTHELAHIIVPVTQVPASIQVLLHTIAPHKQVLPKITGLQTHVVPIVQAAVATVVAQTTPPQTQVVPNTIGEHKQLLAHIFPVTPNFVPSKVILALEQIFVADT